MSTRFVKNVRKTTVLANHRMHASLEEQADEAEQEEIRVSPPPPFAVEPH